MKIAEKGSSWIYTRLWRCIECNTKFFIEPADDFILLVGIGCASGISVECPYCRWPLYFTDPTYKSMLPSNTG